MQLTPTFIQLFSLFSIYCLCLLVELLFFMRCCFCTSFARAHIQGTHAHIYDMVAFWLVTVLIFLPLRSFFLSFFLDLELFWFSFRVVCVFDVVVVVVDYLFTLFCTHYVILSSIYCKCFSFCVVLLRYLSDQFWWTRKFARFYRNAKKQCNNQRRV